MNADKQVKEMGKKIVSIFLSIIILWSSIFLTIAFLLKWNLRKSEIVSNIENNNLSFLLQDRYGKEPVFIEEMRDFLELASIPPDTIDSVLNSQATKNFIGKYTYDVLNYMIYQEDKASITKDDLIHLATDNFYVIDAKLKENHRSFTEKDKQKIVAFINEYAGEVMNFFPTANSFLKKMEEGNIVVYQNITLKDVTTSLKIFLSTTNICIALSILLIGAFLLVFMHFNSKKYICYLKNTILVYIFLFVFIEIMMGTIGKDFLMNKWESANTFINYLVNAVSKNLWLLLITATVFLLILTIIEKVWKRLNEKSLSEYHKVGKEN